MMNVTYLFIENHLELNEIFNAKVTHLKLWISKEFDLLKHLSHITKLWNFDVVYMMQVWELGLGSKEYQ